ncbi:DUF699-domain-containing protein [Ramaria rubella]|nr:DUF699-domain-containing protein [Ramaria rubella]
MFKRLLFCHASNWTPILINNNDPSSFSLIVNLHFLLSQACVSARPSVLWCYKKELGFSSHRKKREAKIKRDVKRGVREANDQDPFEIFVTVTDIRYTYYKESHEILGNTFGMCVLQDFETITPNLLARIIETVEGGGLVVLLLKTMSSLRQLYTMTMDVHARYRTSSHDSVVARFNERFILSLGSCEDCLIFDDELNVLPISRGKDIVPLEDDDVEGKGKVKSELKELKDGLADIKPVGELVKLAKTIDQAQAVLAFVDAIAEKILSSTVTLTAARGRGKSAALGLAIAAALAHGYSNIFVTTPSPENLKTVFEFIFKGMDVLGYEEHLEYDIAQSTNPEFNNAIVRVNYIQPQDAHVLGQAELVIIDEAAAIPLPLVRNPIGPYLVFMASTINGYEGTGRSLSIKLIQQLRESARTAPSKSRTLREIKLETPIRYGAGDKVEKWLKALLCLDATVAAKLSMALFVASHYKNHPNDLQLMSDAPAHHLFVLLPPVKDDESTLPEPLTVLQVALEGTRTGGDMIPWLISQQFQESNFASLSGARVMGYGARALQALNSFYNGEYFNVDEADLPENAEVSRSFVSASKIDEPHQLLQRLTERKPESLRYLGVSYGLTPQLLRFWKRGGYVPFYIRQTTNDLTGEHTCVMVRGIGEALGENVQWLGEFAKDFRQRFLTLLSFKFREFGCVTALSIIEATNARVKHFDSEGTLNITPQELSFLLSLFDLKRLESYANNMLDYHAILDVLPTVASLYFEKRLGQDVKLSAVQSSILLAMGLQRKTVEEVESELRLPVSQTLALFVKSIRKIGKQLEDLQKAAVSAELAQPLIAPRQPPKGTVVTAGERSWKPLEEDLDEELADAGNEEQSKLRERQLEMINALDLSKYAIDTSRADWQDAESQVARNAGFKGKSDVVSVKTAGVKRKAEEDAVPITPAPGKEKRHGEVKRQSDDNLWVKLRSPGVWSIFQ